MAAYCLFRSRDNMYYHLSHNTILKINRYNLELITFDTIYMIKNYCNDEIIPQINNEIKY